MKIIGLDVGTKRIGVARADSSVRIAVPQCTIEVDGTEFDQIARISRVYDSKFFVIGLPRGAEGQETAQSRYSRDFAQKLKKALPGAKICFQDESLTSVEAEKVLKNRKKGYKKGDIDSEAASFILQDFLETFGNRGNPIADLPQDAPSRSRSRKPKSRKTPPKKSFLLIIAIVLAAGCLGFLGCCLFNGSLAPVVEDVDCSTEALIAQNPEACKNRNITIKEGMSVSEIADILKSYDLIRNPLSFQIYAKVKGYANSMKTGRYNFNRVMSAKEIAAAIADGSSGAITFRITTLPGGTLADFKEILLDNGYSEGDIDTAFAATYDHPVLASRPEGASLEGYIYGETIEFSQGDSIESIINKILDEFYSIVVANNLEEKFSARGLTLHEGITLASVVQKESPATEMSNVAGVFYNRLNAGMSLGSDVTAAYAADLVDPNRLLYTDNSAIINIDSCYNTRINPGLPCGPISNPGLSALRAVAAPANNSYLYFLTGDDGMMYYSDTDSGHQINVRDHCQESCNAQL